MPAAKSYALLACGVGDDGLMRGGNVCDALARSGVAGRAMGDFVLGGVRVLCVARGVGDSDGCLLCGLGVGDAEGLILGAGVARFDAGGGAPVTLRTARTTPGSEMTAPTTSDVERPAGGVCNVSQGRGKGHSRRLHGLEPEAGPKETAAAC